jgi:hypothetical protein
MPLTDDELTSIFNEGREEDPPPYEVGSAPVETPPEDPPPPPAEEPPPPPVHTPDDFDDQLTRTRLGRRVSKMQEQLANVVTKDDLTNTLDDYFKRLNLSGQPAAPQPPPKSPDDDFFGIFGDETPNRPPTSFDNIPDEVLERKLDQVIAKKEQKSIDTVNKYQENFIKEVLAMQDDEEFGEIHNEVLAKLTDPKSGTLYNRNFSGFRDAKGDALKNYTRAALAVMREKVTNTPRNPFEGTPPATPTGPRGNPPSNGGGAVKLPEFDEQSKQYIQSMGLDDATLEKMYKK